jgi:hypothetical protein
LAIKRNEASHKDRFNTQYVRGGTLSSILPFVNAAGEVICSFYILPADVRDEEDEESAETDTDFVISKQHVRSSRSAGHPRFFVFTKTGFLKKDSWGTILKKASEVFRERYPGLDSILLCDQVSTHKDVDAAAAALKNGMLLWFLPPNTTHFLQ